MNTICTQALVETLNYLMVFNRERIQPEEAKTRLRTLQQRYPSLEMKLLWQKEKYDQSLHYDVLLNFGKEGTISLSICPDCQLPWPMRGVQRWSESDLVRVNSTVLRVEQAISCLDFIWGDKSIMDRLVNFCLLQEEFEREPIDFSDEELQQAMDGFRRAHKLYTARDTYLWMEQRGLTHELLERNVINEAFLAKLRERITHDRVESYFAEHHDDFDSACIASFEVAEEASAYQIYTQIQQGEIHFYEAAQQQALSSAESFSSRSLFTVIRRRQTLPHLAQAIFAAKPDEVLSPLSTETGYVIVRLISLNPASLDKRTYRAIADLLVEEWLKERRQAASIEWYWGKSERLPSSSIPAISYGMGH